MPALSSAISIARERTGTDSNSFTNALAIDFANVASFRMKKMMIDRGIDAVPVQESYRSVTDGVGTYLYPSDMFYIPKNMEVNWFEGTVTTARYVQIGKLSDTNIPPNQGINWLRMNQPAAMPLVDYRGDYFEIFPTPSAATWGGSAGTTLTAAMRLFYYLQPTASSTSSIFYAATTDVMTNPEGLDHFSFAELMAGVYLNSIGKISDDELDKVFDKQVGKIISIIQGDGTMPTRSAPLVTTGWEF